MSELIVMCGAPASGKTTWCKNNLSDKVVYVSRDEIRFSLLKEGENYFAHENEVYKEFTRRINEAIKDGKSVVADATHLNSSSRCKLLKSITEKPDWTIAVVLKVPLKDLKERNDKRTGLVKVPEEALLRMYNSFRIPSKKEGFDEICVISSVDEAI